MSVAQLSGFILISLMIWLVYLTTRFVAGASYRGNGIYHITINAWFRGNEDYKNWLNKHKIYHWSILLVLALCPTILLLIEPFSQNKMLIRPELSIYVNVMLWIAIIMSIKWFYENTDK